MNTRDTLQGALLALGLEDWIPIPEAVGDPEVRACCPPDSDVSGAVAAALRDLLLAGEVRLYAGRWDAEPREVSRPEALNLLSESRWYEFHLDDPSEERLYFVNVRNVRED